LNALAVRCWPWSQLRPWLNWHGNWTHHLQLLLLLLLMRHIPQHFAFCWKCMCMNVPILLQRIHLQLTETLLGLGLMFNGHQNIWSTVCPVQCILFSNLQLNSLQWGNWISACPTGSHIFWFLCFVASWFQWNTSRRSSDKTIFVNIMGGVFGSHILLFIGASSTSCISMCPRFQGHQADMGPMQNESPKENTRCSQLKCDELCSITIMFCIGCERCVTRGSQHFTKNMGFNGPSLSPVVCPQRNTWKKRKTAICQRCLRWPFLSSWLTGRS